MNFKKEVYNLNHLTGNVQDSEDALQDAAVHLLVYGKDLSYLSYQGRLEAIDSRKKKQKMSYIYDTDALPCSANADTRVAAKQELAVIFKELNPINKLLMEHLIYAEGSCTEAADDTEIGVSNFKTLVHRIRHNLKR